MKDSNSEIQKAILATLDNFSSSQRLFIGYSGGVDSHVLLHACATLAQLKDNITAVYIHHGLQAEADAWAIHCEKVANNLGVDFLTFRVDATPKKRESPEEAARNARYTLFQNLILEKDVLLMAQHREDQLETVLLQLFRGSGLKGISGMPQKMPFAKGHFLRPLLNIGKDEIDAYALANKLEWIEDPSNQSLIYDRNFLRQKIIPQLKQRWQSLDKTISRTSKHCAEAEMLIENLAQTQFEAVFNTKDKTLDIPTLLTYSEIEQRLILRQWFQQLGLRMPSQDFVQRILNEVVLARIDRHPILHKNGVTIRRHKTTLNITVAIFV